MFKNKKSIPDSIDLTKEASQNLEETKLDRALNQTVDRRNAIKGLTAGLLAGTGFAATSCNPMSSDKEKEASGLKWQEYFQKNYRIMSPEEKNETVKRLERSYELQHNVKISVSDAEPLDNVLYGYAFNISKCQGYMDCIDACIKENNLDRKSDMQYIRIHEQQNGSMDFSNADDNYYHMVPAEGNFYMGTQCFHCENPPCVDVCPVKATWKEKDGIVVVDYNWCIGCRYCMAACPYDGRRFNWSTPEIPSEELNKEQHYLGNRPRMKGVMEKCTFCIQRSRKGQLPACADACPTGARVFGNLLDPKSEIRWVLEHKKVFRLKEDLGTEPKFWYYMD